ncbi:MAG TPA: chorismate mutase [Thermoplasmata archaeon]|nr:chorismate mutase [Thermoplasmata archaeon]
MPSDPSDADLLARIRQEIESVDRSIVLLLAARLDAARRAIRVRARVQNRLTDTEQERRIFQRTQDWAEELRLPPKLVESLFRSLIEEGKARYLSEEALPDSPVVTVLLSRPRVPAVRRYGEASPELGPVSTAR